MSSSFRFQCLPALAIAEVVKCMDFKEKFNLSISSRKTNSMVQWCTKKTEIQMKITHGDRSKYIEFEKPEARPEELIRLWIQSSKFTPNCTWQFGKAKNTRVPIRVDGQYIRSFWKNETMGFETIMDFMAENFTVLHVSFDVKDFNSDPEDAFRLMQRADNLCMSFENINWQVSFCKPAIGRSILEMGSTASFLSIHSRFNEKFKFEGFHELYTDELTLAHAPWLTVADVCALNYATSLRACALNFDSKDLNRILRRWKTGDLVFLEMHLQLREGIKLNLREVFYGLNARMLRNGKYRIQAADGIDAIVKCDIVQGLQKISLII